MIRDRAWHLERIEADRLHLLAQLITEQGSDYPPAPALPRAPWEPAPPVIATAPVSECTIRHRRENLRGYHRRKVSKNPSNPLTF